MIPHIKLAKDFFFFLDLKSSPILISALDTFLNFYYKDKIG